MQEGHELDITAVSDSDDNYEGILDCTKVLPGFKNQKTRFMDLAV